MYVCMAQGGITTAPAMLLRLQGNGSSAHHVFAGSCVDVLLFFIGITEAPVSQTITKPPLKAVPVTVTPLAAAPAKPTPRGGLATCTFNVEGSRESHLLFSSWLIRASLRSTV